MVHLKITLIALIATASTGAHTIPHRARDAARLDKPVLQPALPDLSDGFIANLDSGSLNKIELWNHGSINEDCKKWMADFGGVDLKNDVEMYNVTFSDCDQPWVFCRHKAASYDIHAAAVNFARLPVLMRSHIRHVILLPPTNHNGKSISNQMDNVIVMGDPTYHEFVVGVTKSMDSHGFDRTVGPFSKAPKWQTAFDRDLAVPNSLASLNQQENLAQMTAVALYEKLASLDFRRLEPAYDMIRNQYQEIQNDVFQDSFTGYGEKQGLVCKDRQADSPVVLIEPTESITKYGN